MRNLRPIALDAVTLPDGAAVVALAAGEEPGATLALCADGRVFAWPAPDAPAELAAHLDAEAGPWHALVDLPGRGTVLAVATRGDLVELGAAGGPPRPAGAVRHAALFRLLFGG